MEFGIRNLNFFNLDLMFIAFLVGMARHAPTNHVYYPISYMFV
jgi:hypothetical protein